MAEDQADELTKIRKAGIDPYAHRFDRNATAAEIIKNYSDIKADEKVEKTKVLTAGRIRSKRKHGGLVFVHIEDFSGRIQIFISASDVSKADFELMERLNVGDFIGVEGCVMKTSRGELSILAKKITLLTKALLPLPSEWYGLKDEELRYRKRYLDMLLNPEVKDMLVKKSVFWRSMRDFMISKGFIEVYTPVLENTTGGADAKPFITHHNTLDIDVYLRISTGELWQKMLLVGGFEKTFEIGRIFRNEGMDADHAQDYNQLEFYWAYADYKDNMKLVEEMYKYVIQQTFGTMKFHIRGTDVDFGKRWKEYDYTGEIKKGTGIDINHTTAKECIARLDELGVEYEKKGMNLERAVDSLWKHCRKKINEPGFLVNHPLIVSPLAKKMEGNPKLVERFQVIFAGTEAGNGYSELNDPIDQEQRFMEQAKLRTAGDEEAQMFAKDFVEALKYGMPPATGFGVSDRLFSLLMDKSIRECTTFPLLRPE
ncbi:MAG: lysine--tRNA ligase [Candidatus Marsarchaeota archaeon]|jgi:lysyl-tRNA synthetase class 2|nr:lysine--tRNA ligase [Candidatus Marsarchaeota archaeon]